VVSAEEKAGKWIRIDVAFEAHSSAALHIEDHFVSAVARWTHFFIAGFSG
jgi:hypothetical protein